MMNAKWVLRISASASPYALGLALSLAGVYVDPSQEFIVSAIPGHDQYAPRLWGDFVAWHHGGDCDVYAKKLSSGEVISVGEGGSPYVNIHAQTVVWCEGGGASPVWAYDLNSRLRTQVTGAGESPDVYANYVAWETNHSICVKDLQGGSVTTIPGTGTGTSAQRPAIFGDTVVWTDAGVIKGHNLATGTAVTASTSDHASWTPPDIHGDVVVWRDNRNGNLDIYAADISDPYNVVEIPVCTHPMEQGRPNVYGSIVVWTDYRDGDQDIYGYDLQTYTEFPIAIGPGNQFSPTIYDSTVMWSHELGGQVSIHGNTVIPEPTTLSLLALGGLALVRRRRS